MQLQQAEDAFSALDVQLVVVTFQGGPLVRAYLDETGFPWPILIDEQREVYRAYGMFKAQLRDLWGPATWWAYAKELVRGRLPRWPVGDTSQRVGMCWSILEALCDSTMSGRDQQIAPRLRDSYKSGTALSRQRLNKQVI